MKFDWTISFETIITLIYCIITAFIFLVSFRQFILFNKTNNAQFLHNLYTIIFTKETFNFVTILQSDCVKFDINNNAPIFKIDCDKFRNIYPKRDWDLKEYYTANEVDLILLNSLDSVGSHVAKGAIDLKSAHQYFGWYVSVTLSNSAIRDYLTWIKEYENIEYVFQKLQELNKRFEKMAI